jgi:hypothetical protein
MIILYLNKNPPNGTAISKTWTCLKRLKKILSERAVKCIFLSQTPKRSEKLKMCFENQNKMNGTTKS